MDSRKDKYESTFKKKKCKAGWGLWENKSEKRGEPGRISTSVSWVIATGTKGRTSGKNIHKGKGGEEKVGSDCREDTNASGMKRNIIQRVNEKESRKRQREKRKRGSRIRRSERNIGTIGRVQKVFGWLLGKKKRRGL